MPSMQDAVDDPARTLVDRVRSLLPDRQLREVRMFGALAVMVDDAMAVAAYKDGSMLVRVDAADDARLLRQPGVARAEMGAGRSMGEGWLRIDAEALVNDAALDAWLRTATDYLARRKPTR